MKKQSLILSLIIIVAGIFIFAGCSSSTDTSTTEPTEEEMASEDATRLVSYSDDEVKHTFDDFTNDYNKVKAEVDSATSDDAETVKKDVDQLRTNVEKFDDELSKAVEDGKITEDVKKGYDTTIETMKTDLDGLDETLEGKMNA